MRFAVWAMAADTRDSEQAIGVVPRAGIPRGGHGQVTLRQAGDTVGGLTDAIYTDALRQQRGMRCVTN